ncbi:MAG: hypothetical protein WAT79_13645 [Saprospiraceae bacterium]
MKQKISLLILCLITISIYTINGQKVRDNSQRTSGGFDYTDVYILESVTFFEPSGMFGYLDWIQIISDFDPNMPISGNQNTIAWQNGMKFKPIGYVSGVKSRVSAEFQIDCSSGNNSVYFARALNNEGYNFPPQQLVAGNGTYTYVANECEKDFEEETIKYWENFELQWQISNNSNGPWLDVEVSKNYLYVTHKRPILGQAINAQYPTYIHHTTLHLSCLNGQGLSDEQLIVESIYDEFEDKSVKRFGGTKDIQYWGPGIFLLFPQCRPIHGMLSLENTTCGTWAQFFNDMIRIQGVSGSVISVLDWYNILGSTPNGLNHMANFQIDVNNFFQGDNNWFYYGIPDPENPNNVFPISEFSVKNWDTSLIVPRTFVMSEADLNHMPLDTEFSLILDNSLHISWAEQLGMPDQGYDDPKSEHTNHAIVKYEGKYYDPSYGTVPKNSPDDWETDGLEFFQSYLGYTALINGLETDVRITWIAESNTSQLQSRFTH